MAIAIQGEANLHVQFALFFQVFFDSSFLWLQFELPMHIFLSRLLLSNQSCHEHSKMVTSISEANSSSNLLIIITCFILVLYLIYW